jgi:hypothetical protein
VLQSFVINVFNTQNGVPATQDFSEAVDSVEELKGNTILCGARTYVITYQDDTSIDWVTHALREDVEDTYTITVDPTLDSQVGTHTLKITCTLDEYPAVTALVVDFTVVISSASCECNRIEWDAPTLQSITTTVRVIPALEVLISHGTVNADSLLASPQIRVCQGSCSTVTTISAVNDIRTGAIPSFMALDSTTGVLTIDA